MGDISNEPANRRTVDEWADVIRADFRRSVEGVIAAGRHLQEAKDEVAHGDWLPLLKRLKIGERMAQMLMTIAENEVLADPNHWFALPPSWRTLYELATLSRELVREKIADGSINPEMTREEAGDLCRPPEHGTSADDDQDDDQDFDRAEFYQEHWRGMPEFRMDPPKPFQKINVLFTRWEDVEAFGRAIRQPVTRKTKSVWYPPKPKRSRKEKMFHSINPNPPLPSTPGWKPREAPSDESAVASVPFMITRHMRNQLHRLGYSDDEIAELTPQEAHDIVRDAADFDDDEITSKLHRCGYSDDEIAMLTPQEAHDIVRDAADTADDDEITSND